MEQRPALAENGPVNPDARKFSVRLPGLQRVIQHPVATGVIVVASLVLTATLISAPTPARQWEYKADRTSPSDTGGLENWMNSRGREGWELVSVSDTAHPLCVFKKSK
jgi:hypothetical protein